MQIISDYTIARFRDLVAGSIFLLPTSGIGLITHVDEDSSQFSVMRFINGEDVSSTVINRTALGFVTAVPSAAIEVCSASPANRAFAADSTAILTPDGLMLKAPYNPGIATDQFNIHTSTQIDGWPEYFSIVSAFKIWSSERCRDDGGVPLYAVEA